MDQHTEAVTFKVVVKNEIIINWNVQASESWKKNYIYLILAKSFMLFEIRNNAVCLLLFASCREEDIPKKQNSFNDFVSSGDGFGWLSMKRHLKPTLLETRPTLTEFGFPYYFSIKFLLPHLEELQYFCIYADCNCAQAYIKMAREGKHSFYWYTNESIVNQVLVSRQSEQYKTKSE